MQGASAHAACHLDRAALKSLCLLPNRTCGRRRTRSASAAARAPGSAGTTCGRPGHRQHARPHRCHGRAARCQLTQNTRLVCSLCPLMSEFTRVSAPAPAAPYVCVYFADGNQQAVTLRPAAAGNKRRHAAAASTQPAGSQQGTSPQPKRLHSELGGTLANAAADPKRARAAPLQQAAAGPAAAVRQAAAQPRKTSAMGAKRGLALVCPGFSKRVKAAITQQAAGAAPDAAPASGQPSQAATGAARSQRPDAGEQFVLSPNGLLHVRPTVIIAD